eukprot:CAMPEP_0195520642 /NCGR_PEP_ID=MMETSP0794_2-20130614/17369_1 /TAXON_ID=515487 /ORGANISM="Stephanopyxis turris, Strain CCMP 815" /LENGTH=535 /DNA_ID=CAMNT_0040650051 /DNA_START=38 /DNA_END=1642 /DNA_ORIENTATION=-
MPSLVLHGNAKKNDANNDRSEMHGKNKTQSNSKELFVTIIYLSTFAVIGESLRSFLGRLFGGECSNKNSDWLYNFVVSLNLCLTTNGISVRSGGALFACLPANIVGCFIMGATQPSRDLGLLNTLPIAFLSSNHWFQSWKVTHIALRTGLLGSLTTFASWNTQMVAMITGTVNDGSQFFSAIFGYFLGLEAALASLVLGQNFAIWMHRYHNPHMAKEEDVVIAAFRSRGCRSPSKVNTALPDYERRYLASFSSLSELDWAEKNAPFIEGLRNWKRSTDKVRHSNTDFALLATLHEIEKIILVLNEEPDDNMLDISKRMGWDVASLQNFSKDISISDDCDTLSESKQSACCLTHIIYTCMPFLISAGLLVTYALMDWTITSSRFYRTRWLSALFAPFGVILRWRLSFLNGKGKWKWFPTGTFIANLAGSMISAIAVGVSIQFENNGNYWIFPILSAIKIGFAGCLTTLSTFAVESNTLRKNYPQQAKGFYYMFISLFLSCVFSLAIYAPLTRSGMPIGGERTPIQNSSKRWEGLLV